MTIGRKYRTDKKLGAIDEPPKSKKRRLGLTTKNGDAFTDNEKTPFCEGDTVKIQVGEYCGKMATIIETYPGHVLVKIDEDGATRLLPTVDISKKISHSSIKSVNGDDSVDFGTEIATKNMLIEIESKSLSEAGTKHEVNAAIDSKSSAAANEEDNNMNNMSIGRKTINDNYSDKSYSKELDKTNGNITSIEKNGDIKAGIRANVNEEEGTVLGMDVIRPRGSRLISCSLSTSSSRNENRENQVNSNEDDMDRYVVNENNTDIINDNNNIGAVINEKESEVLGMEVVKTKAYVKNLCSLSTGSSAENRNNNKDYVCTDKIDIDNLKSPNVAGTVCRHDDNDCIGTITRHEEGKVLGTEPIRNHNNSSKDNSVIINNNQITVYQYTQPLSPPPEVGSIVQIKEGMFEGYQGIVVEGDGGTIGQGQPQEVSVEIFNDDIRDDSKSIVMINPSRLSVTKNITSFLQQQRLQLTDSPPTKFADHIQISGYDEQSWNNSHSLRNQQNRIDEKGQHCWDNMQDSDRMCYLDRVNSKAVAATIMSPDNYKGDGMMMNRGDDSFFANQSDGERYDDINDSIFYKADQVAAEEKDYGKIIINDGDDDVFSNNLNKSPPLPISSSLDKQKDDDGDDIVFYNGSQAAVQERDKDRMRIFLIDGTEKWIKIDELDGTSPPKNRRNTKDGLPSYVVDSDGNSGNANITNNEWLIPGYDDGGLRFSGQLVRNFRLGEFKEETFIDSFLRTRKLVVIKDFNNEQMKLPIERIEHFCDGNAYELISTKVMDETGASSFNFSSPRILSMVYVQISGPKVETINIQELLSRIADFGSLKPRKMVARLELFQSPAWTMDSTLHLSDFQEIPEEGQIGCGFIGESMLKNLLLKHIKRKKSVSNTIADITICIQVRLFIPSLGVYKGVLMKKQIPAGSPQIQLPSSMRKIGPSRAKNPIKGAFLVINRAGLDPSDNSKNIGRIPHIDPHSPNACPQSFTPIVLNDMILRMFSGLGASRESTMGYFKRSKKRDGLEHAFVRGVSDPTGKLPPGTIFLSGTKNCKEVGNELFVTRSPCLKHDDARMLPVVTSKPANVSLLEWNWLNKLPFGVLIFALPKKGMKSLPEFISNGDLDGDRYFVCWNREILEQIKADPIVEMPSTDPDVINPGHSTIDQEEVNPNWLLQAQEHMCSTFVDTQKMNQLIGYLYKTAQATADRHNSLRHQDVTAYAIAFGQALDNAKHGGKVELPERLYRNVRANLRELLTSK